MQLTKKDIIAINQKFSEGNFENESSLDYALSCSKQNMPWTKKLAYFIRAILIDHVFSDGNKRTTFFVFLYAIEENGCRIDNKKALGIIKSVVLKNITSIKNIRRMIEDAVTKNN